MTIDPIVYAYVAKGATQVVNNTKVGTDLDNQYHKAVDRYQGEFGIFEEVLRHVAMLEQAYDEGYAEEGLSGVFLYEVAEPFGEEIMLKVLRDEHFDAKAIAINLLEKAK